jgi:hypothetical protein
MITPRNAVVLAVLVAAVGMATLAPRTAVRQLVVAVIMALLAGAAGSLSAVAVEAPGLLDKLVLETTPTVPMVAMVGLRLFCLPETLLPQLLGKCLVGFYILLVVALVALIRVLGERLDLVAVGLIRLGLLILVVVVLVLTLVVPVL